MKSVFWLLFFIVSVWSVHGQQYFSEVIYQQNIHGHDMVRVSENVIAVAGKSDQYGLLFTTDTMGGLLWARRYQIGSTTEFNNLILRGGSNLIITGTCNDGAVLLMNVDLSGDTIWSRSFEYNGNAEAYTVSGVYDDGFVLCGHINTSVDSSKMFVIRTDQNGNLIWSKVFESPDFGNYAFSVKQTPDSCFIVVGTTSDNISGHSKLFYMKLDSNANILWKFQYMEGSSQNILVSDVCCRPNGFIISGTNACSPFMASIDLNGSLQWAKTFSSGFSCGYEVAVPARLKTDGDNYFYMVLPYYEFTVNFGCLVAADSLGNCLMAAEQQMLGTAVLKSDNGDFFLLGNGPILLVKGFAPFIGSDHIGFMKTDSLGTGAGCGASQAGFSMQTTLDLYSPFLLAETTLGFMTVEHPVIHSINLETISGCVDITGGLNEMDHDAFIVYPNPSNGAFSLQFDNPSQHEECLIELYSPLGTRVFSATETMREEIFFEVDDLTNGLYYLVVSSGTERVSRIVEICR